MTAIVFPDSPSDGDTFKAQNGAIYTYDSVDDSWTGRVILSSTAHPDIVDFVNTDPFFDSGDGTQGDPYVITPATVAAGGTAQSTQVLQIDNLTPGQLIFFNIHQTEPNSIRPKFTQPFGHADASGTFSGRLQYNDALGADTTEESTYVGLLHCGSCYFSLTITQEV